MPEAEPGMRIQVQVAYLGGDPSQHRQHLLSKGHLLPLCLLRTEITSYLTLYLLQDQ